LLIEKNLELRHHFALVHQTRPGNLLRANCGKQRE
jgi:hypothetical protein